MCVCMCVCYSMCVCVCVCVCVFTSLVYTYMIVSGCISKHNGTLNVDVVQWVYTGARVSVCTCVCMYVCVCVSVSMRLLRMS